LARRRTKSDQDDAGGGKSSSEDQITEIKIFGNQDAFLAHRLFEYLFIAGTGCNLGNRKHIMPRLTQGADHRRGAAFVREEVHVSGFGGSWHAGEENHFFVGYGGGAVGHRGTDIFRREVRIVFEELGLSGALSELAQDEFDRDAGSANHGFTQHYGGIDLDSLCGHA
jgi:hypothetical protein